jgi:DNA-binding response OmpR family regulator
MDSDACLQAQDLSRRTDEPLVLLVDDEPEVLAAVQRCLRREGVEMVTAGNAREALERLSDAEVDLVIADQRLPDMTGTDLLRRIHERFPLTACAILTADHALTIIREGGRAGAAAVLFKPWKPQLLRMTVRRLLRRPRGDNAEGPAP